MDKKVSTKKSESEYWPQPYYRAGATAPPPLPKELNLVMNNLAAVSTTCAVWSTFIANFAHFRAEQKRSYENATVAEKLVNDEILDKLTEFVAEKCTISFENN